jgi:hypothetical protein
MDAEIFIDGVKFVARDKVLEDLWSFAESPSGKNISQEEKNVRSG